MKVVGSKNSSYANFNAFTFKSKFNSPQPTDSSLRNIHMSVVFDCKDLRVTFVSNGFGVELTLGEEGRMLRIKVQVDACGMSEGVIGRQRRSRYKLWANRV